MSEETDQSEKTEDPSQKKLDDALKRGDVAKSQELSSFFVMVGATVMVGMLAAPGALHLSVTLKGVLMHAHDIPADQGRLVAFVRDIGLDVALAVGLPLLAVAAIALAGNLTQHRFVWSTDPITPKLSKISPLAGFKRLFSKDSLMNFFKGLLKIGLVSSIIVIVLMPERDRLDAIIMSEVAEILPLTQLLAMKFLGAVLVALLIIGGLDFAWQKHKWFERQKMTLREVKDEYKQQEGDPTVKAKLRQIRLQRSRQRMMSNVPDASVVVTNPTHYAVALKYEPGMAAPICVAKGVDTVAFRIREVAKEADVPVVENPPLARALYATVELEEEVPPDQYKAVANLIGYVMRLREKKRH